MKNIYKTILNTIVTPLCDKDRGEIREIIAQLKQTSGESWAIGESVERSLRYIEMTTALVKERKSNG